VLDDSGTGNVSELGKKPLSYDDIEGQYMGLTLFRAAEARRIGAVYDSLDPDILYDGKDILNMYMTSFLQHWIDEVSPIRPVPIQGGWLEIDTTEDLEVYENMRGADELDRLCRLDHTD
jgi:choline kinase